MSQHDDKTVPDHVTLIRAVLPDWIQTEDGKERLTSATFKSGQLEASCFILEEIGGLQGFKLNILPVLEADFGFKPRIATLAAKAAREAGLWIYRKAEEFNDNPAHVVICPSGNMTRSKYARQAGSLKEHARLLAITEDEKSIGDE